MANRHNPESSRPARKRVDDDNRLSYDNAFAEAYRELQDLARHARRRLSGATLDTTALVHECYLRLAKSHPEAHSAGHFLTLAAKAMRHLLIERARARVAGKRGAGAALLDIAEVDAPDLLDARELLEIDDLLRKLETRDAEQAAVVECRFFGGLNDVDTAAALGISPRSVQRQWSRARAWMAAECS